jgi:subtilase family serine protease
VPVHRRLVAAAAVGATLSFGLVGLGAASSGASSSNTVLAGTRGDYANPANLRGHVNAGSPIDVEVVLKLRNADEAQAVANAVSTPSSPNYRHYLSTADWNSRFAPTDATVASVKAWLTHHGLKVGDVPSNNLFVPASGTPSQIERAFSTTLNNYSLAGKTVRGAATDISIGSEIAGSVDGVVGIDDTSAFIHPSLVADGAAAAGPSFPPGGPYPPTAGFRNAPPCSKFSGTQLDTTDPSFGGGWPAHMPYQVCGFTPAQLRQAYGMDAALNRGFDGTGQTVAIIDAYDSPTILKDAQMYASVADSQHPLAARQFTDMKASSYRAGGPSLCDAPGWFSEQSLDVEAVHGMAPGAHIVFVAGRSCLDVDLIDALNKVVSGHLAQIVSNSYGNNGEAVPKSEIPIHEHILSEAAATGIGVYFSSGDFADEWETLGQVTPDFPADIPGVTAVGGTSLSLNQAGPPTAAPLAGTAYGFETGWETGKSYLCTTFLIRGGFPPCIGAKNGSWNPPHPGFLVYGSGGGTSRLFAQPSWQAGVVPDNIAEANGKTPMRAVPDVAADADPTTGMLIGQTQAFPNGVYWDTYRIGGTSLACPLFAGMMALADQVAGAPHGFANPLLYSLHGSSTFHDVVPHAKTGDVRVDFLNGFNGSGGTFTTVRTFDYQGPEIAPTGLTHALTLHPADGWDNQTGNGSPDGWAFLDSLK